MQTHDVSACAKTGEALLALVLEDIKWSKEMYGLMVIAAYSDDGGDACRMRWLLLLLMPWLIIILSWAHQINLIVSVRATPKSNSVDNVQALQGDATVLEKAIKL